jgi:hypothetical protein
VGEEQGQEPERPHQQAPAAERVTLLEVLVLVVILALPVVLLLVVVLVGTAR